MIECSYRDIKSDGWQWHRTRLTEPGRAERQWLAMAVALLWTLTMETEDTPPSSVPKNSSSTPSVENTSIGQLSCFVNGLLTLLGRLLNDLPLTMGSLQPLPFGCFYSSFSPNSS